MYEYMFKYYFFKKLIFFTDLIFFTERFYLESSEIICGRDSEKKIQVSFLQKKRDINENEKTLAKSK